MLLCFTLLSCSDCACLLSCTTVVDDGVGWWCLCLAAVLGGCVEVGNGGVGWLDGGVLLLFGFSLEVQEAKLGST